MTTELPDTITKLDVRNGDMLLIRSPEEHDPEMTKTGIDRLLDMLRARGLQGVEIVCTTVPFERFTEADMAGLGWVRANAREAGEGTPPRVRGTGTVRGGKKG